ncbi:MAG: hypothetical protein ACLP56_21070 [Candidatus Sulfotelmatobacter sp.]
MERFLLIDPLAMILRSDIYVRLHLPDPPVIEILQQEILTAVQQMSSEEIGQTLERVRSLATFADTAERIILDVQQSSRAA